MRMARRVEDGRQVRVVEWGPNTSSDLGIIGALLVAIAVCPAAVLGAVRTSGWVHIVCTAIAVLAGLVCTVAVASIVVLGVIVGAVRERRITPAADALLAVGTAVLGGTVGVDAYYSGGVGLALGPAAAALVAGTLWSRLSSRSARARVIALAVLGAAASVAVGASVYW